MSQVQRSHNFPNPVILAQFFDKQQIYSTTPVIQTIDKQTTNSLHPSQLQPYLALSTFVTFQFTRSSL